MNAATARPRARRPRTQRIVPWAGGLLIAAIVGLAAYDIARSYDETVANTGRELDAQARALAEQTARSIQAVDVVLRHFSSQFRSGAITLEPAKVREYLQDQSVGLVQIDAMAVFGADGVAIAATLFPLTTRVAVGNDPQFKAVRNEPADRLLIGPTRKAVHDGRIAFPMVRRLDTAKGEFTGVIVGRGNLDYYQQFYRDVRPDPGTAIALMHADGTLVARHPPLPDALGGRFDPLAGGERFGSKQRVGDYPLTVVVTRDASAALKGWRAQSIGTAFRTLALSALAALLLVVLMRQLARLYRTRESLEVSQERFALAVDGSTDGIVDWDVVNDRMYSSKRAMEIVGLDSEVTTRSRGEWRDLIQYHPEDAPRLKQHLEGFLAGTTELRDGEYRVLLPDGSYRWIRHRNKCVRDEHGRPTRVAGSISDIDAQKRAEEKRLKLEAQLLQSKKLEAIGTLAGGIAHDFNNILAAILGNGELAQGEAKPGTPLKRHVDAVVAAGLRAKSLVERILAFSRSGIGERVAVDVEAVVEEALALLEASLPAHVRVERRLAAAGARVMGDATQIHQVVMNLCTNAVQAIKSDGTLTVALDLIDTVPATSALPDGSYLRLAVSDSGSGMSPETIERVFDPFFTTKEVGVGTGLGLSLVHGIVTDLGGAIDVESRTGVGTTFTVYLPTSTSNEVAVEIEAIVPNGEGETILLVDDEEALVRLGEETIARLGYEPVGFTSSAAALAAFRESPERFQAVLTDEAMPEMTGSELAQAIRAIRPDVPIVIMSGFVTSALSARARAAGVAEVLGKPLVAHDIAAALARALRREPA